MPVSSQHAQYDKQQKVWTKINDAVAGGESVLTDTYLINPDPTDTARFDQITKLALYVNFTKRTLEALNAAMYVQPPTVRLPAELEFLRDNADGIGNNLSQILKQCTSTTLQYGRVGVLVDYTGTADQPRSLEETKNSDDQTTIVVYKPQTITNWQVKDNRLILVVLAEEYDDIGDDAFVATTKTQYRVLRLIDGVYTQEIYRDGELFDTKTPTKFTGQTFEYIPFYFIGAITNSVEVDPAPIEPVADINLRHLLSSSIFGEAEWIASQPTLFISTDTSNEQFKEANPNGIKLGSRVGHNIGRNASAVLLQAKETNMSADNMRDLEQKAVMVGARLVMGNGAGAKTEVQATSEAMAELSVANHVADNVADAFESVLWAASEFETANPQPSSVEYNVSFFYNTADPQLLDVLIKLMDRNTFSKAEMRGMLLKLGVADEEVELDDINDAASQDNPLNDDIN